MTPQLEHVYYTRNEWTTVTCFVEMIKFLKDKNIEYIADIGSNVGEVSKIFLEEFDTIKDVYAYEPQSQNYDFLSERFLDEDKLHPIKKGIFYGDNQSHLYNNGGCGSYTVAVSNCDGRILYPVETIDLVELENENLPILDLVKLDVEGAEYNILKHSDFIKKTKYLIIEFHPFGMDDIDFFQNLPSTGQLREERVSYIKKYTDSFIKKYLPNYNIVIEQEEQYLLELKSI
jgi:FkbM family methyltransferase